MYSVFFRNLRFRNIAPIYLKRISSGRFIYESASNEHNVKKFKRIKRLASTLLFGGTFLIVVWARNRKCVNVFDDAKLVSNSNYQKNFKLYEYKEFMLPSFVMKNLDHVKNFTFNDGDILVVSFPKTGTTWLQEIIYSILNGVDETLSQSLEDRFPYLEFMYPGLKSIQKMEGQRLIKTHLPYSLLPEDIHKKNVKILYIMRNPKDVVVSYYHFVRMMTVSDYSGNFENFFQEFLSDKVPYGPLWKHYQEMWDHLNEANILILFYEDLHKDIQGAIKKIATFLDRDVSDEEINNIVEHCSFHNMAQNPNVNYQHWDDLGIRKIHEAKFMRKGEIGDWKNYFTSEMCQSMDLWIEDNLKEISPFFNYDKFKSNAKQ
ncbi:sulfotransferase 1E1 [Trichonephila inaurata madagascariensis]|uniref:Sulfotransferase 1E1 n=1 Tax=Trichonephila inaurata madagascariensis TaxID=2747483 RepID=A0A8X6YL23_9ARAC|nr:sulfotransferase 1E1 [Trichonephila inaurata madagascariensis]